MKEHGLPELTDEQIEHVCLLAEEAAREYVLSQVSAKKLEKLDICAQIEGRKPFNLTVDVDLLTSSLTADVDEQELADSAVKAAFSSVEAYLRNLQCPSQK